MKLSEKLLVLAAWLEDAENDLIVNADAEGNEICLTLVANALVNAAEALKDGAQEVNKFEPNSLTVEKLEEMAAVAQAFDESEDPLLKKQASVLDEILLTLAAPKNAIFDFKRAEDDRIEQLRKKYKDTKLDQDDMNKVSDSISAIEKSPMYKEYRPLEAPLSTRCCPDHPGALFARVGEHTWQCVLDKKIYNYDTGFKTMQGNLVPGGSVEEQTKVDKGLADHAIFDTRNGKLGLE